MHDSPNLNSVDLETGRPKDFVSLGEQLTTPPEPTPSLTALMEKFLSNANKLRTDKTKIDQRVLGGDFPSPWPRQASK